MFAFTRIENNSLTKMISNHLKTVINIFFPKLCFGCQRKIHKGVLCSDCRNRIIFLNPPLCRFCCQKLPDHEPSVCGSCQKKTYPYDRLISVTAYKEPMPQLIHQFKYNHYTYLSKFLSRIIIEYLKKINYSPASFDFITSVPIHRDKLKSRGFNQSELLGKSLSNYFKIPFYDDIIAAVSCKVSQTKLKIRERITNVQEAFIVKKSLQNKNIILVDDIITTGATVLACCEKMKNKGAKDIAIITLAKT